ncbi:DNA/RNA-binding protein Alba-like [Aphelenchoides avenae]|nr:DNA/RNA-binding protein Alba-like [Aphelenchus avenae]
MDDYMLMAVDTDAECECPFPAALREGVLQMEVKKNTKFRNILTRVEKEFQNPEVRRVMFHGVGEGAEKCISCAEVFKKKFTETTHQWTKLTSVNAKDIWAPNQPEMDTLAVEKRIPAVYIMVSRDPYAEEFQCASIQASDDKLPSFLKRTPGEKKPFQGGGPRHRGGQQKRPPGDVPPGGENPWKRPDRRKGGRGGKAQPHQQQKTDAHQKAKKEEKSDAGQSQPPAGSS